MFKKGRMPHLIIVKLENGYEFGTVHDVDMGMLGTAVRVPVWPINGMKLNLLYSFGKRWQHGECTLVSQKAERCIISCSCNNAEETIVLPLQMENCRCGVQDCYAWGSYCSKCGKNAKERQQKATFCCLL